MSSSSEDVIDSIPADQMGLWAYWSVRDQVDAEVDIDSDRLRSVSGLFLGFGSGDRKRWAKILPELTNIRYLVSWTGQNSQGILDAIVKMTWLERLCFGRLAANDLAGLEKLDSLEYFCAHQMVGARNIRPITKLRSLRALEVGLSRQMSTLDDFTESRLPRLKSLIVYANRPKINVDTVKPLTTLSQLEFLSIPTIHAGDGDLSCLTKIQSLRFVHLSDRWWSGEQVETLRSAGVSVKRGLEQPST